MTRFIDVAGVQHLLVSVGAERFMVELAGGSVRCMLAGIHLTRR